MKDIRWEVYEETLSDKSLAYGVQQHNNSDPIQLHCDSYDKAAKLAKALNELCID
jgi:hypothetical protein